MAKRLAWWLLGLALAGGAVCARDYTLDWKPAFIIQPELRFDPSGPPDYRWRRLRFAFAGPITANLKAKVQVDGTRTGLRLFDLFADYTPLTDPVRLNLKGGLFYPAWAHEGQTFPNTINYSYITTATGQQLRNFGGQASVQFLDLYQVNLGVFNGVQGFDDTNGRPNYLVSFEAVPPWFDCRAFYLTGYDGTSAAPTRTELWSAEITEANVGPFGAEAMFCMGRRFGKRVIGAYVQGLYRFGPSDEVYLKYDWANLDQDTAGSTRTRYVASYHHKWKPWLTTFADLEYSTVTGDVSALLHGDFRF